MSRTFINCLFLWFVVCQVSSAEEEVETLSRDRRSVFQLREIIQRCTGRSALDYNGYGCYCGIGGRGTPMDAVDRCCQRHDNCYTNTDCQMTHSVTYSYSCNGCSCQCRDLPGCKRQACLCDVEFGRCLAGAGYNRANKGVCR
ncbi:hypothetical protein Btru_037293 [Bulinus truncatus]|nr:hypothetical protein Btru_037293 [Bulinus truncatus]